MKKADGYRTKGIYIHVPFCVSKCPYCDFYSMPADEETKDAYVRRVIQELEKQDITADTVYFGGGTPSLLGGKRISEILQAVSLAKEAEVTLEANPGDDLREVFSSFAKAGGNRVSMGLQAADEPSLKALGRRHTVRQAREAVMAARQAGITNISLDLMLGIPCQTKELVKNGVDFCSSLDVPHVSFYMLKLEPNTPFGKHPPQVPDDDETAELYLYACGLLEDRGYEQYEISNFAKPGMESRHNRKYWNCDEVLAIGPGASGYEDNIRYAYPRDLGAFLGGTLEKREDTDELIRPGSEEEYAMLQLRQTHGLVEREFIQHFGKPIPEEWRRAAGRLPDTLVLSDDRGIRLTRDGFLVSNQILTEIL